MRKEGGKPAGRACMRGAAGRDCQGHGGRFMDPIPRIFRLAAAAEIGTAEAWPAAEG